MKRTFNSENITIKDGNIEVNKEGYEELKSIYKEMEKAEHKSFIVNGFKILTDYCRYLLEFLSLRFEKK